MRKVLHICVFYFLLPIFASAEEIHLKDGMVIKGDVSAVTADLLTVVTPYGTLQINKRIF